MTPDPIGFIRYEYGLKKIFLNFCKKLTPTGQLFCVWEGLLKGGKTLKEKNGKLTQREKMFCIYYVSCGNSKEAAFRAGYRQPEKNGAMLLMREDIAANIDILSASGIRNSRQMARSGYERLAFGDVTDAVRLMFEGDPSAVDPAKYDLFNVAEIKRPKDGAMEIKFFDRIKALEKLEAEKKKKKSRVSDFYSALVGSIAENTEEQESGI